MKRFVLIAETLVVLVIVVTLVVLGIRVLGIMYHACQHGCLLGAL